ncbi:type IV secretory system conjugative DNA transfer family protein [Maribacter flavus]|uniref:Type IV secretion system DNA-binding domain-containing protein n=1 Tax=Maribacter flavus TaxID=1658664 RepID=A0A5B2TMT1_9FLAO|nr:type IV secretory system conjugative DNA transfer family protein [Maribacter flavus]KAA2215777.1 type IV secretion system DNA-binding domain-containing protein [Maribacter flavus]
MESQKIAFSAMFISVICFLSIGFLDHYPTIQQEANVPGLQWVYSFLKRFGPLERPYFNRLFLLLTVIGAVMCYYPKKVPGKTISKGLFLWCLGVGLLLLSQSLIASERPIIIVTIACYFLGFVLSLWGTLHLFQVVPYEPLSEIDPFNVENETFQQMEQRIDTPYSVNIPYDYYHKGLLRRGWINFINLFRGLLVVGTPGSGKSFAVIEEILEQLIQKKFTLLLYDFKFDTLSTIAYNYWLREKQTYGKENQTAPYSKFYVLNFDNVEQSHRCNPLDPYLLKSQMDASDAATVIMKNLNKEWIKRNDFFSRSAISFVSGLIWYLKRKSEEYGKNICTLPHVIILSTVNIEYLLSIMLEDIEVRNLMIPFKDALEREAGQQLAGQTASAQISLSMLANKEIFYVMTGNDFQLDINNPEQPKIVCIQNNPNRSEIYAAPIGLYINKTLQLINRPGCRPCGLLLDELPTVFIMGLRKIIDTGRSHLVATVLGIQSISQLIADYGRELADVIFDNCANIFSGAAKGETARRISEIFGRIHQSKKAHTLSKQDTTMNISSEMMDLLPKSKISGMSTGYFGGMVADTFEHPIPQKLCYGLLRPNLASKRVQKKYALPAIRTFVPEDFEEQLQQRIQDLEDLQFYNVLYRLDWHISDYYGFYHDHIPTIAANSYISEIEQWDFINLVKDYGLFDYRTELSHCIQDNPKEDHLLKTVLKSLIARYIKNKEKNRVLDANFHSILEDVEELVQKEYVKNHGTSPSSGVFDTEKVVGMDHNTKENQSSTEPSGNTDTHLNPEELLDRYTGKQEKPTFGDRKPKLKEDLFVFGSLLQASEPYSSYPVEIVET